MIGLDTNVIVRYLTQDDPEQARRVNALVERSVAAGEHFWITTVALCETVCVLRSAYGLDRQAVLTALDRMLATARFAIESKDAVRQAVEDYRSGRGDFADYVIGRCSQESGCSVSVTFDRNLKGNAALRVI